MVRNMMISLMIIPTMETGVFTMSDSRLSGTSTNRCAAILRIGPKLTKRSGGLAPS